MNITLFGYQGCGKTYFGKKLAERLSLNFVDTDRLVEALFETATTKKHSIRDIFQMVGEPAFRALEKDAVQSLQNLTHSVIAVGGGIILSQDNVRALQELGAMVFLDVDKELLRKRMMENELPAFIDPMNPEVSFNRMYEFRRSIYENIPAGRIPIDENKSDEDVLGILEQIYKGQSDGKQ